MPQETIDVKRLVQIRVNELRTDVVNLQDEVIALRSAGKDHRTLNSHLLFTRKILELNEESLLRLR